MGGDWLVEVPSTRRVLMRRCAASDCEQEFEVKDTRRVYCCNACRKHQWLKKQAAPVEGSDAN